MSICFLFYKHLYNGWSNELHGDGCFPGGTGSPLSTVMEGVRPEIKNSESNINERSPFHLHDLVTNDVSKVL